MSLEKQAFLEKAKNEAVDAIISAPTKEDSTGIVPMLSIAATSLFDYQTGFTIDERVDLWRYRRYGLVIGGVIQPPWAYPCAFIDNVAEGVCRSPGIAVEYTKRLCNRAGIPCSFVSINTSSHTPHLYDAIDDTASIVRHGLVITEAYDLSLPVEVETGLTATDLSFTTPLFFMEDGVLTKPIQSQTEFMFQPFENEVWLSLAAVFVVVVLLDTLFRLLIAPMFHKHKAFHWYRGPKNATVANAIRRKFTPNVHDLGSGNVSWLSNFALFIQRGVNVNVAEWSRRVLYGTLSLSSIVICGMYSAFLVSHRVAVKITLPFPDMESLTTGVESGQYKLLIDSHSTTFLLQIRTARDREAEGHVDLTFSRLNRALEKYPAEVVTNITAAYERVDQSERGTTSPMPVLYASMATLRAVAKTNCRVRVQPLPVMNRGAFAVKKTTKLMAPPLAGIFNKLALTFREFGDFMEKQEIKYTFGRKCTMQADSEDKRITINNLRGAFTLIIIGTSTGVFAMLLERVYVVLYREKHQTRSQGRIGRRLENGEIATSIEMDDLPKDRHHKAHLKKHGGFKLFRRRTARTTPQAARKTRATKLAIERSTTKIQTTSEMLAQHWTDDFMFSLH